MKYYIPTSSLNFDNILQSESISPYPFYVKRITGYKSIEVVPELRGIEKLVLFPYPVHFTIDDPNRYNFPLLIEIEDEDQLSKDKLRMESEGVYSFSNTLYLTPTNCRFFFFSEYAYNLTTINSKSNKAIKFYKDYQIFSTVTGLQLREIPTLKIESLLPLQDTREIEMDKRKGLMYAYLLGQTMSVSPEMAHQNKLTQDIYDIVSGILTNYSKSNLFREKLSYLLEEYKAVDKTEQESIILFEDSFDAELGPLKIQKSYLIDKLKEWEVWDCIYRKFSKKWDCKTLPSMSELVSIDDYRRLIAEVERRTKEDNTNYKKNQKNASLDVINFKDGEISIKGLPLLSIAINYIVTNNMTSEQLSAHRADFCKGMINKIKDYYISKNGEHTWNDGPRSYFNNLYAHIQNVGFSFEVKAINNDELSAIAAFLLRGQSIDNYLVYLKMNEFSDYRCPLVLWGALCGYMEMNRDVLTDILTLNTYESVYFHMFASNMYKAVWEKPKNSVVMSGYSKIGNTAAEGRAKDAEKSEDIDEMALHIWQQNILKFAKEKAVKQNKRQLMESLQLAFVENGNSTDYYRFLAQLLGYDGWTTTKTKKPSTAWKKMQEHFAPNFFYKKNRAKTGKEKKDLDSNLQKSLFDAPSILDKDPTRKSIIMDVEAERIISECPALEGRIKDKIVTNFKDFQMSYQSGFYFSHPESYRRDNSNVISHFTKWCLSQKNDKSLSWSRENSKIMDELKNYLLKIYHD